MRVEDATEEPRGQAAEGSSSWTSLAGDARSQALRWAIAIGLVLVLGKLIFAAGDSLQDWMKARDRVAELEVQIEQTEARVAELGRTIEALEQDPVVLERIVREELGYVGPEDRVIELGSPAPPVAEGPRR